MKIAALCIATNFKVRMKVGNKTLVKQEEKAYMSRILKELELWVENSKEEIKPVIITCFDEIYEMAVQKHFPALNNEFGMISEGQMIHFGINSFPNADVYFIMSTSETRIFRAEIFEEVCEYRRNNPNKIVISRIHGKLTLPMVFSGPFIEPVRSIVDREGGRFVLHSDSRSAAYLDITDDMIRKDDFHKGKDDESGALTGACPEHPSGAGHEETSVHEKIRPVVVLRGGGRIATSIAATLYRFGYSVLITETQNPSTIYRTMSFAQAVLNSECEIEGIKAYLVSPSRVQIQKAWDARSIPVIIDPDAEVLKLFDRTTVVKSLFTEAIDEKAGMDILSYLKDKNGQEEDVSPAGPAAPDTAPVSIDAETSLFFSRYPLFALIDAATSKGNRPTDRSMAPITIGLREEQQAKEDVLYKIETKDSSLYGKIRFRREYHAVRITPDPQKDAGTDPSTGKREDALPAASLPADRIQKTEPGLSATIYAPDEGRYKGIHMIGDEVVRGSVIGYLIQDDGTRVEVTTPVSGRLTGHVASNTQCVRNRELAAVDPTVAIREDCLSPLPVDKAVAYSVLTLLQNKIR